ncbi:MAG: hypothetical protein LBS91_03980, partial [Clostridiales Family XIII bacterium]|nr:hypothetical protein [Clostridiales Family XIII bacterium]
MTTKAGEICIHSKTGGAGPCILGESEQPARRLSLGIDVGSTTVKVVVMDGREVLFSRYERHRAEQPEIVGRLLAEAAGMFSGAVFRAAVCGSGGRPIADAIGAHY